MVVGSIAAGVGLTNIEPAQAKNPRVSVSVTNIQTNGNSQSFAAEIVAPFTDFYFTSASVDVTYDDASSAANTTDASQIVITTGTMDTAGVGYAGVYSVESEIADAIDDAFAADRYGDVMGIISGYSGRPADAENASASVALTNIQSNTNSQNFAAEIVAPMSDQYFSSVTATVTYENATAVGIADQSQFLINEATISATAANYTANTVDTATARAIDAANTASRYGDVAGIVRAWQGGGTAALD